MSEFVQPPAPSEARPPSPPRLPDAPMDSASPSPVSQEIQNASASSVAKRPRVSEPITHFLTPSSLSGFSHSNSTVSPSTAALAAVESGGDLDADTESASPKQARVESVSTTPRSPYSNLPRKIPRKTPAVTPTSSVATPTLVTPPIASPASPPHISASSPSPTAKRATLHQRWATLLHDALMKERQSQESEGVLELCMRIVEAIPGDTEQIKDTFQTLLFSIKDSKNGELRRKVVEGELLVERLVTMDDRELANPELRKQIEEKMEERSKDTNLSEIRKAMRTSNSTLFKCHVCGARDSSWEQRQTRSGDEPMTVIITCNKCSTQWRKY
ncbi:transcription elongation factor, putative [Leishmania panamensis]|uniref:Transcription factor S-II (TFIIS), central domain/Transcription factor S-II (TFIIS) n=2 Tax=Leishmania guyanensis species complex TaxID=38579 RepID=A0AAW3BS41_9TRYP|nr:transcription elongation factor, putative [Leishmania panamensis]AIN98655.1 transcription elongation factor, putative [Leishmania panamensis]